MAKQPNICFLRMYVCMVVRECLTRSTIQNKLKCLDAIDMRENFLGKFLCLRIFGKMAGLLKTISIRINLLEKYSFVVVVRIFCRCGSRATNFLFLKHVQIQKNLRYDQIPMHNILKPFPLLAFLDNSIYFLYP